MKMILNLSILYLKNQFCQCKKNAGSIHFACIFIIYIES